MLLFILVFGGIEAQQVSATIEACKGVNSLRQDLIEFVDGATVRSKAAARATQASATATPAQKKAALEGLKTLEAFDKRLAPRGCSAVPRFG